MSLMGTFICEAANVFREGARVKQMVCYSEVLAESSSGGSLGQPAEQLLGRVFSGAFGLPVGSRPGSWEGQALEQALI